MHYKSLKDSFIVCLTFEHTKHLKLLHTLFYCDILKTSFEDYFNRGILLGINIELVCFF